MQNKRRVAGLTEHDLVAATIAVALHEKPGQSARELAETLDQDKGMLNRVLYSRRESFVRVGEQPPRWWNARPLPEQVHGVLQSVINRVDSISSEPDVEKGGIHTGLYAWQIRALEAWSANGCRGIVEAVTGAGKTMLGLAAIGEHLNAGGKTAVVVPSIELLRQWGAQVEEHFPDADLDFFGDGYHGSLESCDVLVATAKSAGSEPLGLKPGVSGLLVADECHTYGAPQARLALEPEFDSRLGLSATYARADGAHEDVLEPYFDGVVYTLGYGEAIDADVVAHFNVALVPVAFGRDERMEYVELSEQVRRARARLVLEFGLDEEPFGEFMRQVNQLKTAGDRRDGMAAGRFLSAFTKRRELLAETQAKYGGLKRLARAVDESDGSIVFTATIESAKTAAATLTAQRIGAAAIHSHLSREERSSVLRRFAEGRLKAIVAPKVLDEGIDVPAADFAVIVAGSRQRRQMIQRMGRVLRKKPDRRRARFAILFVKDTSEDPAHGAHEAFLDEILPVADEVHVFELGASAHKLADFLQPE